MKALFTIFVSLSLFFTSCTVNEKPEYIGVDKVKIESIKNNKITLSANAIFKNKNSFGGTIFSDDIQVFTDDILVGNITATEFNVPKKDTFSVPLRGVFTTDQILEQKAGNLLSKVMNVLSNKKIEIGLKGNLTFKKGPFKYKYAIDKNDTINFGL